MVNSISFSGDLKVINDVHTPKKRIKQIDKYFKNNEYRINKGPEGLDMMVYTNNLGDMRASVISDGQTLFNVSPKELGEKTTKGFLENVVRLYETLKNNVESNIKERIAETRDWFETQLNEVEGLKAQDKTRTELNLGVIDMIKDLRVKI